MPRISVSVALGLGAAGALVDVSTYARLEGQLVRRYGRTRQYDEVEAGSFSFVLDNQDGRFTPDNESSPYVTTLAEGAAVCVQVGSRLTPGRVESIEPTFPDGEPGRAEVRVVCTDMLGDLARDELANGWREALVRAATPAGYYPLDEPADSFGAVDQSGRNRGTYRFQSQVGEVLFGQPGVEHDRIRITGDGDATLYGIALADATVGRYFSFWLEPISTGGTFSVEVGPLSFSMTSGSFQLSSNLPASFTAATPVVAGREYFIEVDSVDLTMKIDGVLQGTLSGAGTPPNVGDTVRISWGDVTLTDLYWSDFALTDLPVRGDLLQTALVGGGAAEWLPVLEAACTGLTLGSLPAGLSSAALSLAPSGAAALDVLNQILTAEQGHAYSTGSGTLLSPVEVVTVRERVRPETVAASFDVASDLSGAPMFERPIRDLVARVEVTTPFGRVTVVDPTVAARAGSSSTSVSVPFVADSDARAWAQDRIIRGSNVRLQVLSIVVDAMTTSSDRSAALLALVPGDRIRLTNLPTTQLGYSTWDAWIVGGSEVHGLDTHTFEFFIAPVLDAPHVFDTARFASGASIKLGRSVRTNLITNPSFETNTTGWVAFQSTITRDTSEFYIGSASLKSVFTGVGSSSIVADVTASQTYTASIWVKVPAGNAFRLDLTERTSASDYVGIAQTTATGTGAWQRVTATRTFGSTGVKASVELVSTIAQTIYMDAVQLEQSSTLGDYFDGDTTDTADAAYDWAGTPKQSPSTEKRQTMTTTATVIEASTLGPLLTTTEEPFDILIGSEQMTVVDVAGTSSPQTVQLVRGVNGTAAAVHAEGDPIEVVPTAIFAF